MRIVLWLAVLAAAVAAGLEALRSRETLREAEDEVRALRGLNRRRKQDLATVEEGSRRLAEDVAAQSNRADAAESRYDEERETTEPLRKQIERMISEKVGERRKAGQLEQTTRSLRERLAKSEKELNTLKGANRSSSARLDKLQTRCDALTKSEADLRKKLDAATKGRAASEARVAETGAALKKAREEHGRLSNGLEKQLAATKKAEARVRELEKKLAAPTP